MMVISSSYVMKLMLILVLFFHDGFSAAAPKGGGHNHHHAPPPGKHHREREADGAFSPRDHGHHAGQDDHDNSFDHEAILGSAKEAEEFDELPPEVAKERLAVLLTRMDKNNNKKIENLELKQWIMRSFSSLSAEESSERFEDNDLNKDNFITWDEYLKEEFDIEDGEDESALKMDPERAEELTMMEEDKYLFNAADVNNDGKLDKHEFLGFTHPEEEPKMTEPVVNNVLKDKDNNKDGKIDFHEYMGDRGKDYDKERLIEEKDRFDHELDKNSDGSLDNEEIAAWIIPSNQEIAADETEHLFGGSDDDHDGVLTFDEVLAHHDLFVGSEATDYGEHLHNIHKFEDEL